jgi:uncharacterized protein (TIGR02217 family)
VGLRSLDDVEALIAFFEARQGQLFGFRWKDWADYKSSAPTENPDYRDQIIGIGDGATRVYQIYKVYRSGLQDYRRPITKPLLGTVSCGVQGEALIETLHFTVDYATGLVTFVDAPDIGVEVTAGYEFDVPVRFDADRIQTSVASFRAGEVPNVPVVEVRI